MCLVGVEKKERKMNREMSIDVNLLTIGRDERGGSDRAKVCPLGYGKVKAKEGKGRV